MRNGHSARAGRLAGQWSGRAGRLTAVTALLAGLATVAAAGWHIPCLSTWHGQQYSRACYSDLQSLWFSRALLHAHQLPYTGADGFFEYPALTAALAWVTGLPAHSPTGFWWAQTLLLLGPALLVSVLALARLVGRRAWMLAAAPTVVLTGMVNWDLLAVAACALGLRAFARGRPGWAAAAFTAGVWIKLYPLMLLIALVGALVATGDRRALRRVAVVTAAVSAAVNAPFALLAPGEWAQALLIQMTRQARDVNSLWSLLPLPEPLAGLAGTVGTLALCLLVPWLGVRAARRGAGYDLPAVALALTAGLVLLGRVHSPQYDLWLLPLLAVSALRWRWWVGFSVVSVLLTLSTYATFTPAGLPAGSTAHLLNAGAAAAMNALLAALVLVSVRRLAGGGGRSGATPGRGGAPLRRPGALPARPRP